MNLKPFFDLLNGGSQAESAMVVVEAAEPRLAVQEEQPEEQGQEQAQIGPHPDPAARQKYLRLHEQEAKIAAADLSWTGKGKALRTIHDEELYKVTHSSFEQYVEERWEMSGRQGWHYINAYKAWRNTKGIAELSLAGAALLGTVAAEKQPDCLREAVAAGGRKPSVKEIRTAIAPFIEAKPTKTNRGRKSRKLKLRTERLRLPGLGNAMVALRDGVDLKTFLETWLARLSATQAAA